MSTIDTGSLIFIETKRWPHERKFIDEVSAEDEIACGLSPLRHQNIEMSRGMATSRFIMYALQLATKIDVLYIHLDIFEVINGSVTIWRNN